MTNYSIMKNICKYYLLPALICCSTLFACVGCRKDAGGNGTGNGNGSGDGGGTGTTYPVPTDVAFWLTKGDQTALLQKQNVSLLFTSTNNGNPSISVDTSLA